MKNTQNQNKANGCECGHSKNLHTWEYANYVEKVEGCKNCVCIRFQEKLK